MPPLARLISLGILTTLIVILGITFFQVLAPFLLPLFLAWVTAILIRPLYLWVCEKLRGHERIAAGVTTGGVLLVVLLPLALGTVFAAAQLIGVATNLLNREDELRQRLSDMTSHPRAIQIARWLEPYLVEIPDESSPEISADPAYLNAPGCDPFLNLRDVDNLDDLDDFDSLDEPVDVNIRDESTTKQPINGTDDANTSPDDSNATDTPEKTIDAASTGNDASSDETPTKPQDTEDRADSPTGSTSPDGDTATETSTPSRKNIVAAGEDASSEEPETGGEENEDSGEEKEEDELSPEELHRVEEAARKRLEARLQASLRSSLRYLGGQTIGLVGEVPGVAIGMLGQFVSLLVAMAMFSIGLYYFLCDGLKLVKAAESLIPIHTDYQKELMQRFDDVVRAVVLSTFLSAMAQGILTTVALWVLGFNHLLVFLVLSTLAAMIPLAGTWVVWGPCAAWLGLYEENYFQAIGLVIYGVAVVGTIDNVIRTYILNTSAKLHPLLAFVSVLGGLQVMGLWGVFIAPIVASCLHALIQIFNTELKTFSQERAAHRDDGEDPPSTPPPAEAEDAQHKNDTPPSQADETTGKTQEDTKT